MLLPQELGARNRDEGQGRCPGIGDSIWWPKFRTGPTELPPARQNKHSAAEGGSIAGFPRHKVKEPISGLLGAS